MQNETYQIHSQAAMDIAGVSRLRFNEAVNAKNYPCAPAGHRGKKRMFTPTDVVGLFLFGTLMREAGGLDLPASQAGRLTCWLMEFLKDYRAAYGKEYDEDQVMYVVGQVGAAFVSASSFAKGEYRAGGGYIGGKVLFSMAFDLRNVRAIVEEGIEDARRVVGVPDADDGEG